MNETCKLLIALREQIERETGLDVELSAGLLLHDVCVALRLPDVDRRRVLGSNGLALVADLESASVHLAKENTVQ